jgi:collagenase-like PrtC family protease
MALNTYPQPDTLPRWHKAVDTAADLGVNAIILADPGLMGYAVRTHPELRLHLSVQGSATSYEAVNFYRERFGIRRAVLPRVLSLPQVENVVKNTEVEIELFAFGGLCVMVEGRCLLSSYACGDSPNTFGACSPGHAVRWEQTPQGHGNPPQRRAHRPLRRQREGRLPDPVQGPLRGPGRDLLRPGKNPPA